MPKKMRRLAVRSALSVKHAGSQIRFVDALSFPAPRTKDALAFLKAHGIEGKALIVIEGKNEQTAIVQRSANNLPNVKTILATYLNVRDLLQYDTIVMPRAAIEVIEGYLGQSAGAAATEKE
jgi:large subunit ribosomal protein L4